jgi:hypothetical protein
MMWLIRATAGLLGISPLIVMVVGGLLGAGGLFIAWKVHTNHYIAIGEARCEARWQAAVKKEDDRRRQEQEEVKREYEKVIADLRAEEERLNDELIASAVEAANDPAANSCGLSPDGVRRIDQIR